MVLRRRTGAARWCLFDPCARSQNCFQNFDGDVFIWERLTNTQYALETSSTRVHSELRTFSHQDVAVPPKRCCQNVTRNKILSSLDWGGGAESGISSLVIHPVGPGMLWFCQSFPPCTTGPLASAANTKPSLQRLEPQRLMPSANMKGRAKTSIYVNTGIKTSDFPNLQWKCFRFGLFSPALH